MPASPNDYALSFDGVSQRGSLDVTAGIRNLSAFTIEAWVKPDLTTKNPNRRVYWEQQGGTYGSARLSIVAVKDLLRFEVGPKDGKGDTNYSYAIAWSPDRWYHVAFVGSVQAETYHMYLNGQEVASGTLVRPVDITAVANTASQRIMVGGYTYNGSTYVYTKAKLDDLRIWKVSRTQQQIADNRFLHVAATEADLVENWRFNEGTGTALSGSVDTDPGAPVVLRTGSLTSAAIWSADRAFVGDTDGDGDGDFDTTVPGNPSAVTASNVASLSFDLGWGAATDNVYVQGYQVAVATDSAFTNHVSGWADADVGRVTAAAITGLLPATPYYARVRAYDAEDNFSAWVNCATFPVTTSVAGDTTAPTAPLALAASAVTYLGFTANWDVSTDNVGVAGYKLDVAFDSKFSTYLLRNLDVGNVTAYPVVTNAWSTPFHYRVRAYDAAENESLDSATVSLTTSPPPDTTPPNAVLLQAATAVGGTVFTARWAAGQDNVGVTGYKLDVATDSAFTTYVAGYQDKDVGNVLAYGVTGLLPETSYWFRARAYDAASNVSPNPSEGMQVVTGAPSIAEGGFATAEFLSVADGYVNSAAPTTNYGTAVGMFQQGDGTNPTQISYVRFDLTEVLGTIEDATLRLYCEFASAGTLTVQGPITGAYTEGTTTWNDRPALVGGTVNFTATTINQWVDVPITNLVANGPTTYLFAVWTTSADNASFKTRDSATGNTPRLVVETAPTTGTQPSDLVLGSAVATYRNYLANPSAEGTFGTTIEATGGAGAVVTQDATHVYHGTKAAKAVLAGSAGNEGLVFKSLSGLGLTGTALPFTGAVHLYAETPFDLEEVFVRLVYTDLTTTDSAKVSVRVAADYARVDVPTVTSNPAKTLDRVELYARQNATPQAATFWADAALAVDGPRVLGYFDGNSSLFAYWEGAQNGSASVLRLPNLTVAAAYLGDSDDDNSATVRYKREADAAWLAPVSLTATMNRVARQAEATVEPNYVANHATNPSAEQNLDGWLAQGTGASIAQSTTDFAVGAASVAVTVGTTGDTGVRYWRSGLRASAGEVWASGVRVKVPAGITVYLALVALDVNGAELGNSGQGVTLAGNDAWTELATSWTLPASTHSLGAHVRTTTGSTVAGTFRVDALQINKGAVALPYADGDQPDAAWAGTFHASETWRRIVPSTVYDVEVTFADPDNVAGTNPTSGEVVASAVPDDALTTTSLVLTPTNTAIAIAANYAGDADADAAATVRWKREDMTSWSSLAATWDRVGKKVTATVRDLAPGTSYDVEVAFTDSTAVYGPNPLAAAVTTTTVGVLPEAVPKISFGGFVLNGREDGKIYVTGHDGLGLPDREIDSQPLARLDGEVELNRQWRKRVVKLRGVVEGADRADLLATLDALKAALAKPQQRLVIDTMAKTNRYLTGTVKSFASAEDAKDPIRVRLWDAEVHCSDPFAYAPNDTADKVNGVANGALVVVANDGNVPVAPSFVFTFVGNIPTTVTLFNETTGERITPSSTFVAGDLLSVESELYSVRKNGVQIDYLGTFPLLAVGTNRLFVYLAPTDRTCNLVVRRRHRFL